MSREAQTIVIKLGTSVLTQGTTRLNRAHMVEIVRQCAQAHQAGHRIIIVTSGAIAAGREHLNMPQLPATMAAKQLLAAVGQSRLIRTWEELFAIYDLHVGQMLLTRADFEDRERFLNARDMLRALLDFNVIPIINENDAVATAEIKVGDNDNLSSLVGILAEADSLLLLTDRPGLFTADPKKNPNASLISQVDHIDTSIYAIAGDSVSGLGTGGMLSKVQAAEIATRAGIRVVIGPGNDPETIRLFLQGAPVGTEFVPYETPLESRKRWLFGPAASAGIHIDSGAVHALIRRGSSLLPKGVTGVSGAFARGDVVSILAPDGQDIAHGVARYGSEALSQIAGKHSDEITSILGYSYGPVAIHRDECIIQGFVASEDEQR